MRRFILDTGIVLLSIRGNPLYDTIEKENQLSNSNTAILISVVTKAELLSLAKQLNWGENKQHKLDRILNESCIIIDISKNDSTLLDAYSTIDAYSQGRLQGQQLGMSSRNMGKNDLWIAATAYVTNSTLITGDGDFNHLHDSFLNVIKYPLN